MERLGVQYFRLLWFCDTFIFYPDANGRQFIIDIC